MKFLLMLLVPILLLADLSELINKAKAGDADSITKLAYIYENGLGVKKDISKAKDLYSKAAKLGSKDAEVSLSLIELENSVDKEVSIKNSVNISYNQDLLSSFSKIDLKNMIKKAKEGDRESLFSLAVLYENGFAGVKANRERAIGLYKKAYENGSMKAKNILLKRGVVLDK